METLKGFAFQALEFDGSGKPEGTGIEDLAKHVKDQGTTDVILICHGFRNDANDARALYGAFLETFAANAKHASLDAKLKTRKFAVGGVLWPSMIFPEPDDSQQGAAQSVGATPEHAKRLESLKPSLNATQRKSIDEMVALLAQAEKDETAQLALVKHLMSLTKDLPVEAANEFQAAFAAADPETVRKSLVAGDAVVVSQPGSGGASVGIPTLGGGGAGTSGQAQSFFGKVFGFVPKFLNLTTFLFMFHRCKAIGENGMSAAVRKLRAASPAVKIHLVGHSLGGRAVSGCALNLLNAPAVKVDTMMLLEAAYSHFGLSPKGPTDGVDHPRGFFCDVIEKQAVRLPILATHSEFDTVVGFAYTAMAAASLNNARAFGDAKSPFGGIGRNGVLGAPNTVNLDLKLPGQAYTLSAGRVINLNGSVKNDGKPLIGNHGDVRNAAVTWAFASLVAES